MKKITIPRLAILITLFSLSSCTLVAMRLPGGAIDTTEKFYLTVSKEIMDEGYDYEGYKSTVIAEAVSVFEPNYNFLPATKEFYDNHPRIIKLKQLIKQHGGIKEIKNGKRLITHENLNNPDSATVDLRIIFNDNTEMIYTSSPVKTANGWKIPLQ